ncbi:hypothetical protein SAMN02745181_0412 [Rubritalea squalenifaciens DSM 18772]|uniref:Uncharacterized protein n=1 Tax=Rubritalea squalenifaciens DSM 18772 TaxID=1123071 RepID=A0A1M6C8K2_9BACT|nr:hypothetical protein [Rubritalea squalenifaciens]SHI57084.1 hypothetical protein SAMN02745181_0412 [Rubritalea squalenifaciens DSM 18772]
MKGDMEFSTQLWHWDDSGIRVTTLKTQHTTTIPWQEVAGICSLFIQKHDGSRIRILENRRKVSRDLSKQLEQSLKTHCPQDYVRNLQRSIRELQPCVHSYLPLRLYLITLLPWYCVMTLESLGILPAGYLQCLTLPTIIYLTLLLIPHLLMLHVIFQTHRNNFQELEQITQA